MDNSIINEYIKVAEEKFKAAKILFENEMFDDSVSRAYYAVFHCVQAMLLSLGISAESHSGAKNLFGHHFVKTGKIDTKFAKYLKELKDERESGDYGVLTELSEEDAKNALTETEEFITEAKKHLKIDEK